MSKASEEELATLHGAIARGLTTAIETGVPVLVKNSDGTSETEYVPAPAAYFMAGITLLKNNNITADAGSNADLNALQRALSEKRKQQKGKLLSRESLQEAADALERDLGDFTQ